MGMTQQRRDGRAGNELRPFASEQGALFRADGSARMSQGRSTVLAAVYGPGQARNWRVEKADKAALDVCFKLEKGVMTSKEKEYEQIIRETFTPVVLTDNFPRAIISIVVQVIEDDGSISFHEFLFCCMCCFAWCIDLIPDDAEKMFLNLWVAILCLYLLAVVINAVSLALMDAGVPILSVVTATSCSIFIDGNLYLDPTTAEEEEAVSWITTARSSTSDGVLTCITNGLFTEEQYFACSEACQRASESVVAFYRIVQQKKHSVEPTG